MGRRRAVPGTARSAGGEPAGVQAVGAGDGEQPGARFLGREFGEGRLGLRGDRPLIDQRDPPAGCRGHDPVTACDDCVAIKGARLLFELAGGEPQPHRRAVGLLHVVEGVAQENGEFVDIGGLETRQPVRTHADEGGIDRLVLAALGRQRQAGGGGDQEETGVLVAGIDHRIEAAIDEGVIHGTDRQQPRTVQRVREAGGSEEEEQVLLGDPQLDVLAGRRHAPALRARQLGIPKNIVSGVPVEHPAAVHPGAEIGGDGDIGAGGHDALGQLLQGPLTTTDLGENVAETGLGGTRAPVGFRRRQCVRNADQRRRERAALGRQRRRERHLGEKGAHLRLGGVNALERVPLMAGSDAHGGAEPLHLLLGHQAGMVVLVPREGQAHALDGVGDEAGRLVAGGGGEAELLDEGGNVVAAEIGHQGGEFIVGQWVDDGTDAGGAAEIGQQRLPPRRPALEGQRGIQAVRAVIDPAA